MQRRARGCRLQPSRQATRAPQFTEAASRPQTLSRSRRDRLGLGTSAGITFVMTKLCVTAMVISSSIYQVATPREPNLIYRNVRVWLPLFGWARAGGGAGKSPYW